MMLHLLRTCRRRIEREKETQIEVGVVNRIYYKNLLRRKKFIMKKKIEKCILIKRDACQSIYSYYSEIFFTLKLSKYQREKNTHGSIHKYVFDLE